MTTTATPAAGHDATPQHQHRLLEGYLGWATGTAGLAETTIAAYTSHITGYLAWLHQHHPGTPLVDTEQRHVEGYLASLADRGCSGGTRRVALHGLRSFYAWALGRPDTPAAAVRRPRSRPPVTTPYTEAQADAILAATQPATGSPTGRDQLAVAVLATLRWTGLRSHELCGLPRAHLDLDAGVVTVVGKGRKQRVIPLPAPLTEHLADYLAVTPAPGSGRVFTNPAGQRHDHALASRALLDLCRHYGTLAGVPGPHTPLRWRHTYASLTLARGADLYTVSRLLGHSRVETTQRYLALDTTQLADAVRRAYPG